MRKILVFITFIIIFTCSIFSQGRDRLISVSELPKNSIGFLNKYYYGNRCVLVKAEYDPWLDDYHVFLNEGTRIEFSKSGKLKEIKTRNRKGIPFSILPKEIVLDLIKRYKNPIIREYQIDIETSRKTYYEVTLIDGLELTYNKRFKLIDID